MQNKIYHFIYDDRKGNSQDLIAEELRSGEIRLGIHKFDDYDRLYKFLINRDLNNLRLADTYYKKL